MREREKRKLIDKTNSISGELFGEPLYLRPYRKDDKSIRDISASTGEKRSTVAQKLIHTALNGKQVSFGENRSEEKLEWLISQEKHRTAQDNYRTLRLERLEEHCRESEETLSILLKNSAQIQQIASELFCMTSVCVSYLNQIFTKMLEFLSPVEIERRRSPEVANLNILSLIEHALADLTQLSEHYDLDPTDLVREPLFLSTKIEKIKERLRDSPFPEIESKDIVGGA